MNLARKRIRKNGTDKKRNKDKRYNKQILKLSKELSIKISSHPKPLEPKGMHPSRRVDRVKMKGIKSNYKLYSDMEEELKSAKLENLLDFDFNGKYQFA